MNKWMIALTMLAPIVAHADPISIEEKRGRADGEKWIAQQAKLTNTACKTEIPGDNVIDWASWKTAVDDKNHHAYEPCLYVLKAMASLCQSDKIAQETVAKDIKKVQCLGDAEKDTRFEVKEGTLAIHTFFAESNITNKAKAWMTKNLP